MESELLRMGKGEYDLSEMFIVRQKYMNQLQDNYLRRGEGNIGQGSLAHTFKNAYRQVGIVPEEVYKGINYNSERMRWWRNTSKYRWLPDFLPG